MENLIAAVLVLGLGVAGHSYPAHLQKILAWRGWFFIGIAAALVAFGLYGFAIVLYLGNPDYVDHIQPHFVSVAWLAWHGHPIYPDWTEGDAYGMLYGPLSYLVMGAFLLLNPGFFMSKLPGLAAFLLSFGIFIYALRKKKIDHVTIFFFAAAFVFDVMKADFYSYGVDPDPFLLLSGALGLIAFLARDPAKASIGLGLIAGLASGFKIHGFLYSGPAALGILAHKRDLRSCLKLAATMVAAALSALLVVHCNPSMVEGYWRYLTIAAAHGLSLDLFMDNLWLVLSYAAPVYLLTVWHKPRLAHAERAFIAGLAVASLALIVVASKPGAGTHHLMPLAPAYLFSIALLLKAPGTKEFAAPQKAGFIAVMLVLNLILFAPEGAKWDLQQWYLHDAASSEIKIDEINSIYDRYPNAQMGVTDNLFYPDTYYRTLGVFRGAPLHFDIAAWMDLAFSHVSEDHLYPMLRNCRIPAWIMPRGEPFTIYNPYTYAPMFSDRFRELFYANYKPLPHGTAYQVWVCK